MKFATENEKKVIRYFLKNHNENANPEDQVDLLVVKAVVYTFMTDHLGEMFDGITDSICREDIYNKIETQLKIHKQMVIDYFSEQLVEDYYSMIEDSHELNLPEIEFDTQEIEAQLIIYIKKHKSVNFTNICRRRDDDEKFRSKFLRKASLAHLNSQMIKDFFN